MPSSDWQRVQDVFANALELAAAERGDFLDSACGEDDDLRSEVETLLAAGEDAQGFLEASSSERAATGAGLVAELQGKVLGMYRITRLLAVGGMGVVLEGVHVENGTRAALKVVRDGVFVRPKHVKLFLREARSLSLLDHPEIAQIYEAGTTDEGLHYFVMEFVDGRALNDHFREHDLDRAARLRLFVRICRAIQYAHERGVIHRDIKPSNILVARNGLDDRIKVLDFGLARIVSDELGLSSTVTKSGQVMGTLAYMSPEQAAGHSSLIDARSDVYSLGVMLFELLTDRLPFDLDGVPLHVAVQRICEAPPRRPCEIDRSLQGDLATIVLGALEKAPRHRFESAAALADDIERHLEGRRIHARRASAVHRVHRFLGRHRWPAALVGSLMAIACVTAVWMTVLYTRTSRAESIAREVNQFLLEMLASADPLKTMDPSLTVRALLDGAARKIEAGPRRDPAVEEAIRYTIGTAYESLGRYEEAELHLRGALELRRVAHGPKSLDVAECLSALGVLLSREGEYEAAQDVLEEALRIHRTALGEDAPKVARNLSELAGALRFQGKHERAEALYVQALTLQRARADEHPRALAQTLNDYAGLLSLMGRYAEARPLYEEALVIGRRTWGDEHPTTADILNNLAALGVRMGDWRSAEERFREVLELKRKVLEDPHPNIATILHNLGVALNGQERPIEAERVLREALAMRRDLLEPDHPYTASTLNGLGVALRQQGRFDESEVAHTEALAMAERTIGKEHPTTAIYAYHFGLLREVEGRHVDAEARLAQAVDIASKSWPSGHPRWVELLLARGRNLFELAELERAAETLSRCVGLGEDDYAENDWRLAMSRNWLASCLGRIGRLEEAERLFRISRQPLIDGAEGHRAKTGAALARMDEILADSVDGPEASAVRAVEASSRTAAD